MKERYENGRTFVEYEVIDTDTVRYTYGAVGFGQGVESVMSMESYRNAVSGLRLNGFQPVTETPISEGNNADAGILLDWMGGITR